MPHQSTSALSLKSRVKETKERRKKMYSTVMSQTGHPFFSILGDKEESMILLLILPHAVTVPVDYGYDQVVACPGDTVSVTWTGRHNIQETSGAACGSEDNIGTEIIAYKGAGTIQSFSDDELVAQPGQTRYFKCDSHCSSSGARFEVSCPSSSPPPPSIPLSDVVCVEDTHKVLTAAGGYTALRDVVPGMQLRTATGSITTVSDVVSQHSTDASWVVPAGTCGSIMDTVVSPAHAVWCDGKWTTAPQVGKREPKSRPVHYVNVRTTDYCNDRLLLDTGLTVEPWDGRERHEWRPHSYANGERVGCTTDIPDVRDSYQTRTKK